MSLRCQNLRHQYGRKLSMKYDFLRRGPNGEWKHNDFERLENTYGLPAYLYSEQIATANAQQIKARIGAKTALCYSAKANYYLAKAVAAVVDSVEVCTAGELRECLRQGIAPENIFYNGIWKSPSDMEYASRIGVGRVVLDSVNQADCLQASATQPIKVFLRLTSGNQFGMNLEEIRWLVGNGRQYDRLDFVGIHYYAGTQRSRVQQLQDDITTLTHGLKYLEAHGIYWDEVALGGGLGVPLYQNDKVEEFEAAADFLFDFLETLSEKYQITYECGRAIATNAGCYVTRVFDKKVRAGRELLLVCGGNQHLRYHGNLVGQRLPFISSAVRNPGTECKDYMICGSLCSAADILTMHYSDCSIEVGDFLIFGNAGAYCLQEAATLFLTMEMPRILVYNESLGTVKQLELGWVCRAK